ncbi:MULTISPECIES: serine/threonine protein kinase [Marichromatium]|uniref:Stress response kinase A n=1 Tax=Marichromatium gracile TaxID=1048 RepID=A0A4R4A5A3_MARGR|nr:MULTISPECIES: serine/threonine protein kinase [Marichromatium]MBO8086718.1 serine/threonine protein kinase [Marichromatium sp.]MBK1710222.1 stress response serine/threonine protein kinase YihE [Marichromatium gracile]RNE88711.1 serine/threonine protein kinase [Marichromatium sp. AB31]RNE94771.1 serine/threonine protein kinase [Marichromatium sp. AB32]TCW33365.1 Ser/Thr protein kinase RdoA (MazF antagonist) [Marichromatium gracile]
MDTTDPTPYADLGPDRILDAIESVDLVPDGRMLALNSYENRVYQIGLDETTPVVVKFYRPGRWSDAAIAEEHDFATELAEREIPAIAPLRIKGETLHHFAGHRFSVSPRRGGRDPELDDPEVLEWVGRFIGRIHAVGATRPFAHRPRLDIDAFGTGPRVLLLDQEWIPAELRETYTEVSASALAAVAECYARAGRVREIRLHGDCHRGNLLWTDAGPHFVDFDDARSGPAVQDLWMLLSGSRAEQSRQLADVLAGYEDFCDFDVRELHLVEALRTLRLIHHAAWLARRWQDPAFPAAFPWFATTHYWEQHIAQLREQLLAMEAGPLWPA